jgi:hypothetical protein
MGGLEFLGSFDISAVVHIQAVVEDHLRLEFARDFKFCRWVRWSNPELVVLLLVSRVSMYYIRKREYLYKV